MKKFLCVFLAMIMVISTFVLAAPSAVNSFDTAKEEKSDDSSASLSQEITLTSDTNLISALGGSITVNASAPTNFTVDVGTTSATYVTDTSSVTVTAPNATADGIVKITASDGTQKNIYIKTNTDLGVGGIFDFSTQGDFYNSGASIEFSNGTVNIKNTSGYLGLEGKDRGISVDDYPFVCFKARSNTAGSHAVQIYMNSSGTSYKNSESNKFSTSFELTNEYKTIMLDMRTIGLSGQFGGMMFCYKGSDNIEIDEITFVNHDSSKPVFALGITADKTTINSDDDTVILTPEFFSNTAEITDKDITYKYNQKMISITKNADGTAAVSAINNGECEIQAAMTADVTATAAVTLSISGVTPRAISRDIHYYALGNSYMEYGYSASGYVGWWMSHSKDENGNYVLNTENRGMAASKAEYDYYHRIGNGLKETYNGNFKTAKFNVAAAERAWQAGGTVVATFDYEKALVAVNEAYAPMVEYLKTEKPNVITVQVQENTGLGISWAHQVIAEWYYRQLYTMIQENRPEQSIVVVIPPIDGGDGVGVNGSAQAAVIGDFEGFYLAEEISTFAPFDAAKNSLPVTTNLINVPDYKYTNPHLAYTQYPEYDEEILSGRETVDFRGHPSDYGFQRMAEVVLPIMYEHIPDVIPGTEVVIPEAFEISGNEAVSGETQYTASNFAPSNAGMSVRWSVDNEELATINEDGILTPKRNGSVKITATSVYDANVYAQKTVVISGLAPHYTISYNAGTNDQSVSGIPASYEYAAENYTFPNFADVPTRVGYKFSGWSERVGGEAVKSVYMDADKTVYAVWEFATDWQFNTDGNLEGITMGGMHAKAANGVATAITYNSGAASVSANNLLIPAAFYGKFNVKIGFSVAEKGDKLVLTIGTKESDTNYTFEKEITSGSLTEYTFNLKSVKGTIDYFMVSTSNADVQTNTITVDYITFERTPISGDVTYTSYEVVRTESAESGSHLIRYNNLVLNEGAVLNLGIGNYLIDSLENAGTINASPNANVLVLGENKPAGYVEFDIGSLSAPTNVRYAEINGVQNIISEYNDLYGIITDENMLVEIIEKDKKTSFTTVSSKYFYINAADKTVKELTSLEAFMDNCIDRTIRMPDENTENTVGLRFKTFVKPDVKGDQADFEITEYGYILALASSENLTLDTTLNHVSGVAYNKASGTDKVFDRSDDAKHIIAGVFYGIPEKAYDRGVDAKMYVKINIDGTEFIVYSEKITFSAYSIAMSIKNQEMTDEMKAIVDNIIKISEENDDEIYFDFDKLK